MGVVEKGEVVIVASRPPLVRPLALLLLLALLVGLPVLAVLVALRLVPLL